MSTSTSKATWTPAYHKIFVDLCLEEILKGNKPGRHYSKEGWRNMIESFLAKTGLRYDKRQLKNHYDATRRHWKIWVKLIGESSMKWDQETKKFGASEEDWHNYIRTCLEAAQFQYKEIPFADKLDIIFKGGIKTEETKTSPRYRRKIDASATSPLHGKGKEKKLKNVLEDCELKNATMVNAMPINKIANDQSMSSLSHPKVKATWTPPMHKIFIDLWLQETLKGNKHGTHFTEEGWKNIMKSFQLKSGLNCDILQFKSLWDATMEQWKIWCKRVGTSYMKWDPSNQKFDASEEYWTNYLQTNPEAAQFRLEGLEFTDILETILSGTTVTGENETPVQRKKNDDTVNVTFPLHAKEPDTAKLEEKTKCVCDAVESRNGVIIPKDARAISSTEGKLNYSIGECIECLDRMEEIEQGSDLYLFALDVFLKHEYREIFLQLRKPNLRISWLQRLQSVGPPLV